MSSSKAATLASRLVDPNPSRRSQSISDDFDDDDAIFAELEEELENESGEAIREHGIRILKEQMEQMRSMKENQHGQYTEITDEKEVVRVSAREARCVIHFYHTNFKRCEIMDTHLARLARKYFNTRFLRVFVENIPWLVDKLGIKVLPCVICFVDGVTKDRLIGFEELGNVDGFDTAVLELRLLQSGVISKQRSATSQPLLKVDDSDVFDM